MQTTTQAQNVGKRKLSSTEQAELTITIKRLSSNSVNQVVCMASSSESGFHVKFDADGHLYDAIIENIEVVANGHELFLNTFFGTNKTVLTITSKECGVVKFGEAKLYKVLVGSMFKHHVQDILKRSEDWNADFLKRSEESNAVCTRESRNSTFERMDEDAMARAIAQIDSACVSAPSCNPEIVNSTIASSVCEQFFGKSFELFGIRGDGNCFCRCLATIVYWLFTNLEDSPVDSPVRTTFNDEFSVVIKSFSKETTILTASDCHQKVRDLINSHLRLQFSAREFTDVVKNNCANQSNGDCSNICQCPLGNLFPQLFDFDFGFRAELLNGIITEMNKTDLSHQDIFDFIDINSKAKEYSACTTMSMSFELLKKYCACQLVTIQHNRAGDSPFSIRGDLHQKDECKLAAIIVFEEHTCENLNHYSLLVPSSSAHAPSSSVQICVTMTRALASLIKAQSILENMGTAEDPYVSLNLTQRHTGVLFIPFSHPLVSPY